MFFRLDPCRPGGVGEGARVLRIPRHGAGGIVVSCGGVECDGVPSVVASGASGGPEAGGGVVSSGRGCKRFPVASVWNGLLGASWYKVGVKEDPVGQARSDSCSCWATPLAMPCPIVCQKEEIKWERVRP